MEIETKNSNENTSYYLGIWNSKKWDEAKKLLSKKFTRENYEQLFCLDDKYGNVKSLEKIIDKYGEEFIIDFFIPILQSIALSSENIKEKIPILLDNYPKNIELTQFECASILSTFFLNMYGNENEGRDINELKNLNNHLDLDSFPDLSFSYYLYTNSKLIIQKMLFMIRYFIKIGIRMAISNKLKLVEHANFLSTKNTILDKVKDFKESIKNIYDFDKEFDIDCNNERNSILKIYLNEFNPILINKMLENNPDYNNSLNQNINDELEGYFKKFIIDGRNDDPLEIISNGQKNKNLLKITKEVFLNQKDEISLNYLKEKIKIHLDSITDQKNNIITDFANKYLGGGCMKLGSVQEEILLLICPEILVARAFVKVMNHIQSISISGFEIISKSKGYGSSLQYDTYNIDDTPYNNNSFQSLTIAVDAIPFYSNNINQFNPIFIIRELIKFCTGLQGNNKDKLGFKFDFCSTGKWGCGAFGGDVCMKFLIQFIACLFHDVGFNFSCFNDNSNKKMFEKFIKDLIVIVEENIKKEKVITKGLIFKALIYMKFNEKNIVSNYIESLKNCLK